MRTNESAPSGHVTPCSPLIGQEGHIMLADGLELPDNLLEELEYLDNITSCNKVTHCTGF